MAETIKKATRESFGEALCELAKENKDIVVFDADLAAATKTGVFKKEFPDRFFDCGIAEGNMMGVAAGMAAAGKIPVAASFAMFATGRAFEQIRNSIAYPRLNVKIAGSHAGISTGEDGATHQCIEDIAIMRAIPNMVVLNPADHWEMKAATKAAIEYNGPVYIRLGRLAIDSFNDPETYTFELGKGITLHEGDDIAVIASGLVVNEALKAVKALEAEGIRARLINIHTIKDFPFLFRIFNPGIEQNGLPINHLDSGFIINLDMRDILQHIDRCLFGTGLPHHVMVTHSNPDVIED